jgi:DNA-binding response OmpR family regulator
MNYIKLLLVDDEKRFVSTLSNRLRLRNFDTKVATDGEAALAEIRKEQPDIVLLDLRMPGISCLEILDRIKSWNSGIEVIILTGQGDIQTCKDGLKAGAADLIVKPIDIENLIEKIQNIMKKSGQKQACVGSKDIGHEI